MNVFLAARRILTMRDANCGKALLRNRSSETMPIETEVRIFVSTFQMDNGKVNRVPISDHPFLKPHPIGTAVQPFVIRRF